MGQSASHARSVAVLENYAEGVVRHSPGLPRSGYPGTQDRIPPTPKGLRGVDATPSGLRTPPLSTQGSRCAATLGCVTQRLRRSSRRTAERLCEPLTACDSGGLRQARGVVIKAHSGVERCKRTFTQPTRRRGDLCVRQHLRDALDQEGAARRHLLRLPSFLHRQAEAGRHRRTRRAFPAQVRHAKVASRRRPTGRGALWTKGDGYLPAPFFRPGLAIGRDARKSWAMLDKLADGRAPLRRPGGAAHRSRR